MLEACLEILLVDHFVVISVEQFKQFKYFLIHIPILNYTSSTKTYMDIMAKNQESSTLSYFGEVLPVYLISCCTSQYVICRFIEINISKTDLAEMYPSLQKSKLENTSVYYLIFASLRYSTISYKCLLQLRAMLIKLRRHYYFIMRNSTIYQDWTNQSLLQNKAREGSQQMGLFTFYRQQAATNFTTDRFNQTTASIQKPDRSKTKFSKIDEVQQVKKSTNCELFLKNIANKVYKPQHNSNKKDATKLNDNLKHQNKSIENPQNSRLQDSFYFKRYNFVLQSTDGFVSRPLKNIEQLVHINKDKIFIKKESKNYQKLKQHNEKQSAFKEKEETQRNNQSQFSTTKHSTKCQKICTQNDNNSLQKSYANTTLQKSFLQKVRFNERSLHRGDKQYIAREFNKKYLFNLIKSVYLPQGEDNQANHILNSTLKSNFIIKRLKTDYSASPPSNRVQNRQMKSVSNKRTFTCVQNEQQRAANWGQCVDLKPSLNQRFRFLIRKQRVTNSQFHHNLYHS